MRAVFYGPGQLPKISPNPIFVNGIYLFRLGRFGLLVTLFPVFISWHYAFRSHSGNLAFPPLRSALGEDAFEEVACGFDVGMRLTPLFGELAFDGGLEDGGFVTFEVGFDAFEIGDGFI